jgi:tetratricopeptide (TPR) repeat protein
LAQVLQALERPAEALEILEAAIAAPAAILPLPPEKDRNENRSIQEEGFAALGNGEKGDSDHSDEACALQMQRAALIKELRGSEEALEAYKEIARRYPNHPQVFAHLAKAFADKEDISSAIQASQHAIRVGGSHLSVSELAGLHILSGHFQRLAGQLDQAIYHLSTAVQLTPQDMEAHLELGLARKKRREYSLAIQSFQRATTIQPQDPRPHYQAGMALKESKDYRGAESLLRQAASLAPDDVNIRKQLAAVVALNLVHNPRSARLRVE